MKKDKYNFPYQAPEVLLIEIETGDVFCISGSHEGIIIEDWN